MTAPAVISSDCTHEDWTAKATMYRDRDTDVEGGPIVAWSIELTANCAGCGAPMLWAGRRALDDPEWEERTARVVDGALPMPLVTEDRLVIFLPCAPHPPGERL
jgi:hypothetical protein